MDSVLNKNDLWVLFGVIGIGMLALLLLRRRPSQVDAYAPQRSFNVVRADTRLYTNKEVVEIEWNSDGLPTKITTHRDARQE